MSKNAFQRYFDKILFLLEEIRKEESDNIEKTAELIAESVMEKRSIFVFGCNHAGLVTSELFYRTGGLVTINPIRAPGMLLEISPITSSSKMERLQDYGKVIFDGVPAKKGDMTVREADDIDEATLSYAEIKAITSANPKIKRKMELDMEVARLRDLESRYKKDLFALQDKIRKDFPEQIQRQELYLERVRKDIETIRKNYKPDTFEINVGGTLYSEATEDGKKNGGLALMDALFNNKTETVVAEYCGLKISLNPLELIANERSITLTGVGQYKMDIGQSASGNLTRLENFVKEFASREERAVKRLEATKSDFEVAKEQVKVPFEHKEKIIELNTELFELNAELDLNKREEVVIDDGDEEDNMSGTNEEVYAALPKKQTKTRTNKKNMLTEKLYQTYKQTEGKNPGAMVFAVKNGDYTCFDDTAEELTALSSLSPSYFRVGEKEVKTLTIDETLFNGFAETFINAGLKIALFDEPKEEKTFIDESDKVAAMQVDLFPDYTVSNEQMHEYGYTWDGMLPIRVRTAKLLFDAGADIYKLGKNDSENLVSDGDFDDTDSLYGIEKPEWERFLISDNGKAYLTARSFVVESASRVVNDEMDYVDGRYVDPLSDRFLEESKAIEKTLKTDTAPMEKVKEHIMPLIENYQKRFPLDVLYEWYGWDDDSVYTALAENITNEELCEYAKEKINEKNFDLFMQEKIGEIAWLAGRNYVEDEIDDIVNDLKPDFEDSYFNKSDDDYPFDEWYDDFSEEKIRPYLEERLEKSADESINEQFDVNKELNEGIEKMPVEEVEKLLGVDAMPDYAELVRDSVNDEFDEFKTNILTKTPEEVFYNNYEIHIKTELKEAIESCDFDTEYFRALYEEVDKGGVLQQLYDDFLDNEYASVSTGSDTEDFIKDYCEHYHSELMKEFLSDGKGVYFGKDEENKSFYYFKDKLSVDTLYRIKEESDEYVIVAPVCYMSQESLEEKNITFLKLDRDVSEAELKINDNIAKFAMQSAYNKKFPMEASFISEHCKSDIEKGIAFNFDGMRLKTDFIANLYALYGEERMNYVLANTVQTLESDGRFSVSNKEWAKQITVNNAEADRNKFVVQSHPAVLDGFITVYRKYAENFKAQLDEEDKQEVEEKTKINYVKVKVANDAFIKKSGMGSVFKMPTNGEYAGFAYYVFNDKITPSRQIVDLQSDSRELCYELKLREDKTVDLFKGRGDDEELVSLSVEEFKKQVDGTTNKDYETQSNDDTKWFNTSVPSEAFIREYDNSMLFRMPNKGDYEGMTYFIPTVFVGEDKNSEDDRVLIRLPEDFVVKAQSRDGEKKEELTAYDFNRICNNTTAEDYKRRYVDNTQETSGGKPSDWNYVSVPEKSRIATYDDSMLFRMPNGEYKDYTYYIPNKCVKENVEKGTIRLSLHDDYIVRLTNNKGDEKKTTELNAKEFCEYLREKGEYGAEYKRPNEEAKTAFEEREKTLRACVPDEMKARANWVAIKTWWDEEKGRYAKRPIDCNTGEYAESDNPDTWTSFDKALDYAREHGGTTIAYALDAKDRIVCVDLDRCFDENGELSKTAKEVLQKSGITYAERSVSGNGVHIFGKASAMDLRTFSKDGDLEFYQKDQFIAMTGDGAKTKDLMNFDTCEMKSFLEKKCEKRTQFIGMGKGVSGLSTMSDKDVVEKASAAKNGEKFKALYSGENLQNNHSNSDMSLMNILAYWCNGDKEQMLRIFATSGLYRPNKSVDYYEHTAIKAIRDIPQKTIYTPTLPKNTGGNGKR